LSVYHYQPGSLARTDKDRNAVLYHDLLEAIYHTFHDMSRKQRKVVRHNLGRLGRQLGYNAYRAGRYTDALRYLARSLRYECDARTSYHILQVTMRWLFTGNGRLTQPGSTAHNAPRPIQ
jgi:hypothetical protein